MLVIFYLDRQYDVDAKHLSLSNLHQLEKCGIK